MLKSKDKLFSFAGININFREDQLIVGSYDFLNEIVVYYQRPDFLFKETDTYLNPKP